MSELECPLCTMDEITEKNGVYECVTCGHEWTAEEPETEEVFEVKDAFGNILKDGDIVQLIVDKKIKGTSTMLKCGDKSKPIRLNENGGDHPISCKVNGMSLMLKGPVVKKVNP